MQNFFILFSFKFFHFFIGPFLQLSYLEKSRTPSRPSFERTSDRIFVDGVLCNRWLVIWGSPYANLVK